MVWSVLMAAVIHAQEVGYQQVPVAFIHCVTGLRENEATMRLKATPSPLDCTLASR